MGTIILFALLVRLRLRKRDPRAGQQAIEAMLNWLGDEIRGIVGLRPILAPRIAVGRNARQNQRTSVDSFRCYSIFPFPRRCSP